jgi:hypothetical protein
VEDLAILRIAAPGNPPAPNVFFAAVHYLLMTSGADALRRFYPNLVRDPLPSSDAWPAFRAFCLERCEAVHQLITTRYVQTNEPARSSYLLPAFHVAHQLGEHRPLALVEIGCSAGLNLCFDRFAFRVSDGTQYGDVASPLCFTVEFLGDRRPPLPQTPTPVARRIGIDLQPIHPGDADGVRWLEALVWPEQEQRRSQLRSAIEIASREHRDLHAGDASASIGSILNEIGDDLTICVFQTRALNQFSEDARARFFQAMEDAANRRRITFISREAQLTLEQYDRGTRRRVVLADTDIHGSWVRWLDAGA